MRIIPRTRLGRWSVGLILGFFVLLGVFFLLVSLGERGGQTFFSNLKLTIPMLIAAASAIASLFVGIVAVFKKERHLLVFLSIAIGLFVLWWCLAEILFPH